MRIDIGDRVYEIETAPARRSLPWAAFRRAALHALFAGCIAVVLVLAVANVLAWRGDLPRLEESEPLPIATSSVGVGAEPQGPAGATTATLARLTIAGRSGPCYLVVRNGGPNGEVLFRGVLEEGQTLEIAESQLWVRVGATQNVALELNDEPVSGLSAGAAELIVTGAGVQTQTGA